MNVEEISSGVRFRCRVNRAHFLSPVWYNQLTVAAVEFLTDRIVDTREFDPSCPISQVRFSVRELTSAERVVAAEYELRMSPVVVEAFGELDCCGLDEITKSFDSQDTGMSHEEFVGYSISSSLNEFCHTYLFLVSVAVWGCLEPSNAATLGPFGERLEERDLIIGQGLGYDLAKHLTAPLTTPGEIDDFVEWSKDCGGIWTGLAASNVEKAFSFLANALNVEEDRSEIARFTWAISALEALAADSNAEVKRKLIRRIPNLCTFLPIPNIAKIIGKAYDFRSRLLHGDIAIHSRLQFPHGSSDLKGSSGLAYDYGMILVTVVMAVLWRCVKEGSHAITFEETAKFMSRRA